VPVIESARKSFDFNSLQASARNIATDFPAPRSAEVHGVCTLVYVAFLAGWGKGFEIKELRLFLGCMLFCVVVGDDDFGGN
jgi:hypothetical protein